MGNCLVLEEKVIKIVKTDGKILEYKGPMKVQQVLSEFSGHAVSDTLRGLRHLQPDTNLIGGGLYYLVAIPSTSPRVKKKVRFTIPEEEAKTGNGVMRIKVVISKHELRQMLGTGGVSLNELVSRVQGTENGCGDDKSNSQDNSEVWKPVLESIPEAN